MIGKFAISKAGHDKAQIYVITAFSDEFVFLSDGRLKPLEKPKKKRIKHIQIINAAVCDELRIRLENHDAVRNEEIKYALRLYSENR